MNPWTTLTIVQNAAKKQNPSEFIYVYVRLNNTSGGPLTLGEGTIILEGANSGANQKLFFAGGPYVGKYYLVTSTALSGNATVDPLNSGAANGRNGTFIALFQLAIYDQAPFSNSPPPGTIFVGSIAINNQAKDSTYSTFLAFTDGRYVRPCNVFTP